MTLLQELINEDATEKEQQSFFNMDDTHKIERMELEDAKRYLMDKVAAAPNARADNIRKATYMINKSPSVARLMMGVSNFILSIGGNAVLR